jgi:hypothetical protein
MKTSTSGCEHMPITHNAIKDKLIISLCEDLG